MLLILLAVLTTPIRWIAITHATIQARQQSDAMREAAWHNAIQAERHDSQTQVKP